MEAEELFVAGTAFEDDLAEDEKESFRGMESYRFGTLYPKGLNMIPGGYAGLKALHKMRALQDGQPIDPEQRDLLLEAALEREKKEGRLNPLLAAHWNDDDYAEKIICGPEGRLKPDQIAQARMLNFLGRDVPEIRSVVGAKNERQISNLLAGRTYSRIKTDSDPN